MSEALPPVEIRLRRKYLEHANGHNKSAGGNSGANKHRGLTGDAKLRAAEATAKGAKVMVLVGGRKRKFMTVEQAKLL
jgi:hypothetical protein